MNKNDFDKNVQSLIKKGMLGIIEVKHFINDFNKIDPEFILNLHNFFKKEYNNLKTSLNNNNEIFFELWDLINNKSNTFEQQAAALSILCYMFESCEVFEK